LGRITVLFLWVRKTTSPLTARSNSFRHRLA